jgi:hypothetical protein
LQPLPAGEKNSMLVSANVQNRRLKTSAGKQ